MQNFVDQVEIEALIKKFLKFSQNGEKTGPCIDVIRVKKTYSFE